MMIKTILSVQDVYKSYGSKKALQGVTFDIEAGQLVGLLGPNGSGKTTLIKIINTLIMDYSGKVLVCGEALGTASKARVSYLPDKDYLRKDMKVSAALGIYRDFFTDFDNTKALEMLKLVGIEESARINTLSKGTREKLQLVLTMARTADLYVFDEPFAGVDPAARDFVLHTILRNYNENAALLFATHLISDVEHFLTRILFIKEGRIVLNGNADDLRETHGKSINDLFKEAFKC